MNTLNILEGVYERLAGDDRFQGLYLDYPGYLHVINNGRHYIIGFDGTTWAVDLYNTDVAYYEGQGADGTGDLAVPEGTTDPENVTKAIFTYIGA